MIHRALVSVTPLLLALFADSVCAGAWTHEAGGSFLKIGFEQWETDRRFGLDGSRVPYLDPAAGFIDDGDYRNQAFRAYGEYGFTDDWTATAAASLEEVRARGHGQALQQTGLSDITLQLKRRLLAAPLVVSALGEVKLPTGYDAAQAPALGTGQVDFGGRLAMGRSLGALYLTAEAGYRVRGKRADEFPFAIEAGLTVRDQVLLRGELSGAASLRMPAVSGGFDPASAESRYLSGGLALVLLGEPLDFVFGVDHALTGRNALAGTRYSFSVWHTR
jgi:hypothetical protein